MPSCKAHLTLFLQSTTGGTVMPTTARGLPGLNMLHSAHAPASSLQFVDGQELLSALLNSSPLFHLDSCLHGLTSYFTGCPWLLRVLFVKCTCSLMFYGGTSFHALFWLKIGLSL